MNAGDKFVLQTIRLFQNVFSFNGLLGLFEEIKTKDVSGCAKFILTSVLFLTCYNLNSFLVIPVWMLCFATKF